MGGRRERTEALSAQKEMECHDKICYFCMPSYSEIVVTCIADVVLPNQVKICCKPPLSETIQMFRRAHVPTD